jgi:hypothetical protein
VGRFALKALVSISRAAFLTILGKARLALSIDADESFSAFVNALVLVVKEERSFALVAVELVTAVSAGAGTFLAGVFAVSECSNRAASNALVLVEEVSVSAGVADFVIAGAALGALPVVAGAANTLRVFEVADRAGSDTTVVVNHESALALVAGVVVGVTLEAVGVVAGNAVVRR